MAEIKKIETLNSFRFFMIMLIVLCHFDCFAECEVTKWFYYHFMTNSSIGVDYFFVLSGFGMMYSYIVKHKIISLKVGSLIAFARNHIRSIYPLYLVLVACCFPKIILAHLAQGESFDVHFLFANITKLALSIPLLQSTSGLIQISHSFNGVSWFLSTLFCIYLVSPLLLSFFDRQKTLKQCFFMIALNLAMILILRLILRTIESRTFFNDLVYGSPYIRVFYVTVGMLLAKIFLLLKTKKRIIVNSNTEIVICLLTLFYCLFKDIIPYGSAFAPYASLLLASLLIFIFSFENGTISKFLQQKKVKILGNMSMYIFLIHYPIVRYFDLFGQIYEMNDKFLYCMITAFITILFTGIASFYLVKKKSNS